MTRKNTKKNKKNVVRDVSMGILTLGAIVFFCGTISYIIHGPRQIEVLADTGTSRMQTPSLFSVDVPTDQIFTSTPTPLLVPVVTTTPAVSSLSSVSAFVPDRLLISSLNVDAHVQQVGISSKGAMLTPTNFTDAGWYKHGVMPGENGTAIIVGHLDNAISLPGVFKHLDKIEVGDDITVRSKTGDELHFTVVNKKTVDYTTESVDDVLGTSTDKPRLALITCAGTWLQKVKTYDKRTVVIAELKH